MKPAVSFGEEDLLDHLLEGAWDIDSLMGYEHRMNWESLYTEIRASRMNHLFNAIKTNRAVCSISGEIDYTRNNEFRSFKKRRRYD